MYHDYIKKKLQNNYTGHVILVHMQNICTEQNIFYPLNSSLKRTCATLWIDVLIPNIN